MENSAATTLYDLLVTRDFEPEILDSTGKEVTDPAEAEIFSFDYKTDNKNYGTVVVLLGSDNNLEVYFGDNLGRTMEGDDKKGWYDFLSQMKQFATRNMLSFNLENLKNLKYTMKGMAAIKEGLFEGYYGNRKMSYSDQPKKTRLVIKHSRPLGENEARFRNIDSLFVETEDGNRFRLPFTKLIGGKAMARHCSEGGTPYDAFGQHISQIVDEMNTLARFVRAAKRKQFDGEAAEMVENAVKHYTDLKAKAKHIISRRGYLEARDSFDPAQITDTEAVVENIRNMFMEQMLDRRIEDALPILARLKETGMKEADEFECWTNEVAGETQNEASVGTPIGGALPMSLSEIETSDEHVGFEPVDVDMDDLPEEGNIHTIPGDINADMLPGLTPGNDPEDYSDSFYYRDPESNDVFVVYFHGKIPRVRGTNGMSEDRVAEIVQALSTGIEEDLDTDGVMMTKPSNMSSESVETRHTLNRIVELAKF